MMIVVLDNCRMKDWKIGDRTVDIQDGAVHGIGECNFPWLYTEVLLFFIDDASSSTLVEKFATNDYENKT
jgi:hypothetical protein